MIGAATMRALVLEGANLPFRNVEVARPTPDDGQVLVRIKASGVNPLDLKIRSGSAPHARHPLPAILGMDLSGIVEQVGPGVTGFKAGDEVYGLTGGIGGLQGSLVSLRRQKGPSNQGVSHAGGVCRAGTAVALHKAR